MKLLLLGSGGRECAFAWKLSQSKKCDKLFIAPGNAGTGDYGTNVDISVNDFEAIGNFCINENISMVIVGPEDPLVNGIRDFFEADASLKNIKIIGPGKEGAQLEGNKDFSKRFMKRHNIPTAAYASFTKETYHDGLNFLETLEAPFVLKADGLAAGKGVLIPETLADAINEFQSMLHDSKFGKAADTIVIEEFLKGIELSVFVLTDGENYIVLPEAKDYKRIDEGDTGLNTGGMGAVSPVPFADAAFLKKVEQKIIVPTIQGLKSENIPYTGFIFIGLMNVNGEPFVIEYNVRMGDPETEVVIPRIKNDLVELFEAAADGMLDKVTIDTDPHTAITVILASGGYPGSYETGRVITGIEQVTGSTIFHAGTALQDGKIVTSGGRVIAVTSMGTSIEEACEKSMKNAELINYYKKYYRKDIGNDLKVYS